MIIVIATTEAFLFIAINTLIDKAIEYKDATISSSIMTIVFILTISAVVFAGALFAAFASECDEITERGKQKERDKNLTFRREETIELPWRY